MSRTIVDVSNADVFQVWFERTNDLLDALSTEIVTANTGGATTTGSGFVIGTFGSNTVVATSIRGGTLATPAVLTFTSNAQFDYGMKVFNVDYLSVNTSTTGTSSQVIDSFALASYRGGEYTITIKSGTTNAYQVSKMLILQDAGSAHLTEYAVVVSNTNIGIFSASANTTHAILSLTPVPTATTVQGSKILTSV